MFYPFLYQVTNMCNTVAQKPLAATPAYVKIPVIAGYWFIMMFGLGYCNVAFNLLSFQRFHRVRKLLVCEYSCLSSLHPARDASFLAVKSEDIRLYLLAVKFFYFYFLKV